MNSKEPQAEIAASLFFCGRKKRHFYFRAAGHIEISYLTKKHLKNVKQSPISDHMLTCNCNVNGNGFTILSNDSNNFNLLFKESLLIARDKLILNKD